MAGPNYFTCTLGQAASIGLQQPHKTINAFLDAQAKDNPGLPCVGFAIPALDLSEQWDSKVYTFLKVRNASLSLAKSLQQEMGADLNQNRTVGLLCPSTPDFLLTWLALMRLGHAVLLIAPQCQPAAIRSLCESCEASFLLNDESYTDLAEEAAKSPASSPESVGLTASVLRSTHDLEQAPSGEDTTVRPIFQTGENDVAYLHHTSGTSSGTPKPIPQTHRAGIGVLPSFTNGKDAATFTTTPLYHGGIADLFRAWTSNAMIWLFPGKDVPITAKNVVKSLDVAVSSTEAKTVPPVKYISSVPYVLQMLEQDTRGLDYLQQMEIVGVGGAALPADVGDRLVSKGVNLISRFGSAECGFLMSSYRAFKEDKEWQYLRSSVGSDYVAFEAREGGLSELIVKPGWPHMAKRNREDGSYATADLFQSHQSIPNAWKYHSRADSQLTLITGKKFDPAPLEAAIATSDLLDDVLIFGNGRPFAGALLFRSKHAEQVSDEELVEQIWPSMEKLNNESQSHAQIARNILVPMSVLVTPLEKSSKGTVLRGAAEKRLARDIEAAYDRLDRVTAKDVKDAELPSEIRSIVQDFVRRKIELSDESDLFSAGIDSVAGMQIRGRLRPLLPQDQRDLPINVVEDCGSVAGLVEYVKKRRRGEEVESVANEHKYMRELVERYSSFKTAVKPATNGVDGVREDGDVVLLTGATGALGAHILDQYRSKPSVRKIYCLVRGADAPAARERVSKALEQRSLQTLEHNDEKVVVLQATLGDLKLGLKDDMYGQLAREATIIMHVAWSVNFRMKLRSFVKDSVAGVTNLINLALASPRNVAPRFAFCSSVASAMALETRIVPEKIVGDPSAATELGYSQSKWVAEQICQEASKTTNLRGRVSLFRVGQLSGDTKHGVWNMSEAWRRMLSAMEETRSLPDFEDEVLNWLPVDLAATALIEGAEVEGGDSDAAVYHVVNEHHMPTWTDMLAWLRKTETFDTISPSAWVEELEALAGSGSNHPALQLLDHWKKAYAQTDPNAGKDKSDQTKRTKTFAMERTKEAVPVLREVSPVDEAYFGRVWGWIKNSSGSE